MRITEEQYEKIKHILLKQRGNVHVENIDFINALLYICENGCNGDDYQKNMEVGMQSTNDSDVGWKQE